MNVSTLSAVFASELLRPQTMPRLLELNSTRLADAYALLTSFLQKMSIDYFPCNAGPFLLAHLAKDAETWDDETIMAERFRQVGVLVGPGRRYHLGQPGWARVCFAMPPEVMEEAMKKMEHVFSERSGETELNQQ
jgi:aspartate/methionine/tyrosine aminotransferase